VYGLCLGAIIIYIGIPNLLVRGPEWFLGTRLQGQTALKSLSTVPQGYSALLAYLNGLGLPLFIAVTVGFLYNIQKLVGSRDWYNPQCMLILGIVGYLLVFVFWWNNFKTHHVLPSIPLLILSFAIAFSEANIDRYNLDVFNTNVLRVCLIIMIVFTSTYAGIGLLQFADDPRDEATEWLKTEITTGETMTVFVNSPPKVGLVHGQQVDHYQFGQTLDPGEDYTDWIVSTPDREPEYIQTILTIRGENEYPDRAEFNDQLIRGGEFNYTVTAEFGETPTKRSLRENILFAGVIPKMEKTYDYLVILEKKE
jgi:hypothetical protein